MRKRESIQLGGIVFFIVSLLIVFSSQTVFTKAVSSLLSRVMTPVSAGMFNLFDLSPFSGEPDQKQLSHVTGEVIRDENNREMEALRDQFDSKDIPQSELLPVRIIGYEGFIPGISEPSSLTINAGSDQGVAIGQAVVYENNLVGKIVKITPALSQVQLLNDPKLTFTAETLSNHSSGVIQGGAPQMTLGNVVLSEVLEKGDTVVTKGDISLNGSGFPPNIVVGQITATEKRQSDLFQLAEVESLLHISDLTTVFVYVID